MMLFAGYIDAVYRGYISYVLDIYALHIGAIVPVSSIYSSCILFMYVL